MGEFNGIDKNEINELEEKFEKIIRNLVYRKREGK